MTDRLSDLDAATLPVTLRQHFGPGFGDQIAATLAHLLAVEKAAKLNILADDFPGCILGKLHLHILLGKGDPAKHRAAITDWEAQREIVRKSIKLPLYPYLPPDFLTMGGAPAASPAPVAEAPPAAPVVRVRQRVRAT